MFALRKLQRQLSSDVLDDGNIAAKFDIPTYRPANLGDNIAVHQDRLFNAFREVLSGKKVTSIVDENDKRLKAKISIGDNGAAQIIINDKGFSFAHVGLLSPDLETRVAFLERYLKDRTIAGVYADELRSTICKGPLTDDDFLAAVGALSQAPESFVQSIKARVASRDLSNADLLPDDERHWNNLVAPWRHSESLDEFLANECLVERSRAFAESPIRAFFATSLSYCAPDLVPFEKLRALPTDTLLEIVDRAASLPDHFAVTSAFELAADRLSTDSRFGKLGTKLLDQLLADVGQLKERCTFFAAVFALTVARLAQHQQLRRKPAFWRRVTAAANASLVIRACGTGHAGALFKWAVEHSGKSFLFSVLLEEVSEPRWKPDWLSGNHLASDAFGRIDAAVNKIPQESRPSEWTERVEKARAWVAENHLELYCALPAIGESARRKQPTLKGTLAFRESFQKLIDEPSVDALIDCAAGIYLIGIPAEAARACHAVISHLQKGSSRLNEDGTHFALQLMSYIAVLAQDERLADAVAEFSIEKVRELGDDESTLELVLRVVECASAYADRQKAMRTTSKRLEAVAFMAKPSVSNDLHDSLRQLQLLESTLGENLGRAIAAANLAQRAAA